MFVHFTNSQDEYVVSQEEIESLVDSLLRLKGVGPAEVSIHFVNVEDISRLHEEYFDDPSPTDCITFPIDALHEETPHKVLGEIFVCPQIAFEYSQAHALDFKEELSLYVVHGILHLLGLDDIEDEDASNMRKEEEICMNHLKKNQLILNPKVNETFHV